MSDNLQTPPEPPKKGTGRYIDAAFILLLVVSVFGFFWGAISGGGFNATDNIASGSFANYLGDAKESGNFPQWISYIFGGMPSFASLLTTGVRSWDIIGTLFLEITRAVGGIFSSDVARVITFYIFYGIGMYLLMRTKKHEPFVAFMTGFAAIFSTYVITWVMIGHNTKPIVLAMFPYIFMLLERLRIKFSLLYAVLLVFAMHLMLEGNHVQMMFYGAIAVGIYFLFELIGNLNKKAELVKVFRSAGLIVLAAGFAFLMSSDRYMAALEYTPHSTRGKAPITQIEKNHADGPKKDYRYSTMWSYAPSETMSFLVPGFFGTKPVEVQGNEQPIYFGAKESEDSPPYMGIGFLALAIIGVILYRRDNFVLAMAGVSIVSLVMSFGKNSPGSDAWYVVIFMFGLMALLAYYFRKGKVASTYFYVYAGVFAIYLLGLFGIIGFDMFKLYDSMFASLPMFYTFRAPSMSLALMHFAVPVLAGYGLSGIIKMRSEMTKNERILVLSTIGVAVAFMLSGFIYQSGFQETFIGYINAKLAPMMQGQDLPTEISEQIFSGMISDWYFSAFVLLAFAVLTYMFVKAKLGKTTYFAIIAVIFMIDMFRVDTRAMKTDDTGWDEAVFAPYRQLYAPVIADKGLFRVVDFVAQHGNLPAYFRIQSVGGYHAAKLRVYQDLMDVANVGQFAGSTHQLVNPFLWDLMNVKYIIDVDRRSQQQAPQVFPNRTALPRAFFVANATVARPMQILEHLRDADFSPRDTVYVEKALSQQIVPPDSTAKVEFTNYENERLRLRTTTTGTNFLFLSEIYYEPCWKATIDGKPTEIIKSNYAFRGVIVPAGTHTVEMVYHSDKFESGKSLSLATNIVFILLAAVGIFFECRRRKQS